MKNSLATVAFVLFAIPLLGQGHGESPVPEGLSLFLPKDGSVRAEWVAPPLPASQMGKAGLNGQTFHLDTNGAVWMSHNRTSMVNLASGMAFSLARPVNDFIFLADGALFLVGDTFLGIIPPLDRENAPLAHPVLPFQPVCRLPATDCSIASDGKEAIYVYGCEPDTGAYAVFQLLRGSAEWRKVFVAGEKINSVSVNAGRLFIASGRMVFVLRLGEKEPRLAFSHPKEAVDRVAYSPGTGLFYATASGVGLVSNLAVEFMKCGAPQIALKDNSLYIFLPGSLGVLRLTNIERLAKGPPPAGVRPTE